MKNNYDNDIDEQESVIRLYNALYCHYLAKAHIHSVMTFLEYSSGLVEKGLEYEHEILRDKLKTQ